MCLDHWFLLRLTLVLGGVSIPPIEDLTTDGYDLQFGTNVIGTFGRRIKHLTTSTHPSHSTGHHYFTKLLLPILISTAKNTNSKTRVVTTSSSAHLLSTKVDYETLRDGPKRKSLGRLHLYEQSKFVSGKLIGLGESLM